MPMKKYQSLLAISWIYAGSNFSVAGDTTTLVKIDLQKKSAVLHAIETEKAKKVDACVSAGHAFAYCASEVMSGYVCTKQNNSGSGGAANNASQGKLEACMAAGGTVADCVKFSGSSGVGG